MQNVVIISQIQSYLIVSLKDWFERAEYEVITVKADIDAINKIEEQIGIILLYVDEKMIEEQQALNFIKDKAAEEDIPLFAVGDADELNTVEKVITKNLIRQRFQRPINVSEVVSTITNYEKKHGKQNKKKILVVDDSGTMLRNIKGWLEESYQVTLANSGAMAIKYLSTNRPDLVLLDYEMPIVDGKQVLEMIRSEHEFADIPVIFLTNKGDKETIMDVMALKPQGYLLKSMEPSQITKSIDDFFEEIKRKELLGM
ncbi:MAG: response regulator [Lachnospiraceae bacterium]|nr:response regulator [Lachnospiraceae bacterium]